MSAVLDLFGNPGFTALLGVVLGQIVGWWLGRLSKRSDGDKQLLDDTLAAFDQQSRKIALAILRGELTSLDAKELQAGEERFYVTAGRAEMGVRRRHLRPLQNLRGALIAAGGNVAPQAAPSTESQLRTARDLRLARDEFLKEIRGIKPEPVPDLPEELFQQDGH